jgi:hypothetical protein
MFFQYLFSTSLKFGSKSAHIGLKLVFSLELVLRTRVSCGRSKTYSRQKRVLRSEGGFMKSVSNVSLGMIEFV